MIDHERILSTTTYISIIEIRYIRSEIFLRDGGSTFRFLFSAGMHAFATTGNRIMMTSMINHRPVAE